MSYQAFQCSRIGALHLKKGLPRQDRTAIMEEPGLYIAVSADGHGNRRHFRSEIGAEFACDVTIAEVCQFIREKGDLPFYDEEFSILAKRIVSAWRKKVGDHFSGHPWNKEELEEQKKLLSPAGLETLMNGDICYIPYGSTLCAVFSNGSKWGAVQIGDGSLTVVTDKGEYLWPMPESTINEGNKTASLCMNDPLKDFRYCKGEDHPAALFVYTDGIDKVLPPGSKELTSLLHWVLENELTGGENKEGNLEKTLDLLTKKSTIGDDISIVGIVETEAEIIAPVRTKQQQLSELKKIEANLKETENTIRFNRERIGRIGPEEDCEVYLRLSEIIARKENDAEKLRDRYKKLRKELFGEDLAGDTSVPENRIPENISAEDDIPQEEAAGKLSGSSGGRYGIAEKYDNLFWMIFIVVCVLCETGLIIILFT